MPEHETQQDTLARVRRYRSLVLEYEALDEQIDALIMAHGGTSNGMTEADHIAYRRLADQRDDVQNEMRALERELAIDDLSLDAGAADGAYGDNPPA
jgi:isopentenyl phosphate kinase